MQGRKLQCVITRLMVLLWLSLTSAQLQASKPLWTITPAPGFSTTLTVPTDGMDTVKYIIQNQAKKPKQLALVPIAGIKSSSVCNLAPKGQPGSGCTLTLLISGSALPQDGVRGGPVLCQKNANGSPNPNQCYRPSSGNTLNITRGPLATVILSVNPTEVFFAVNSSGSVVVSNIDGAPIAAKDIVATIPDGSNIVIDQINTTCGATLLNSQSCTMAFTSSSLEGPTTISIAGDNTNIVTVNVTATNQPVLNIDSPGQSNRVVATGGVALALVVSNDPNSQVHALNVTATSDGSCPDLIVTPTFPADCAMMPPGGTCTLELTSPTPYAPCTITIAGDNTANSPQSLIAFFFMGGVVFESNGVNGKVVNATDFTSSWAGGTGIVGAFSPINGSFNSNAIRVSSQCSNDVSACAAQRCQDNNGFSWYLPAPEELKQIQSVLCSNESLPCNFGGFQGIYWSSQESGFDQAFIVSLTNSNQLLSNKSLGMNPVRCALAF